MGSNQGETAGQGQTLRPKVREYPARLRHGTARRLGGSEAAYGTSRKGEQRQTERRQEGAYRAHHPKAQQRRRKLIGDSKPMHD